MARILIVDDSVISRLNLKKILIAEGHEVIGEGADGFDAIKMISLKQLDVNR